MPFKCHCARCPGVYKIPEAALGKHIRCPHCGEIAVIPLPVSRGTAGPSLTTAVSPPQRINPPPAPTFSAPTPKKRNHYVSVLFGRGGALGLLTIGLASILVLFLLNRGRTEKPQPTDPVTASPSLSVAEGGAAKNEERPPKGNLNPFGQAKAKDKPVDPPQAGENDVVNVHEEGPPLLFQIHSLDRIFADLKIIGEKAKKSKEIAQIFQIFQTADGKKVEVPGIDAHRPWGIYALIKVDAAFGGLVALIPIREETDFLHLLHMLQCSTSKNADGVYEVKHAQLARRVGFRFAKRHAYVALDDFDAIKKENLIEPNKVFVRGEDADVRLTFRMDRLPKELRMRALAGVQEAGPKVKMVLPKANPIVREATENLIDFLSRFGTDLVQDSRELSLRLRIDSREKELVADVRFRAVEKSRLARSLASVEKMASLFGDLDKGSSAMRTRIHFRLPEELRRILAPLVHEALEQTLREATDRDKHKEDERFVRAFEATVAAGELDLALFLNSQGQGKPARTVTGLKVVKGLELEKAFRGLVAALPDAERGLFQFDVAKAEGTKIHRLDMRGKLPPAAVAVFGADSFFFYAFREDAVLIATGANAAESIQQVLANRSRPMPPALLELNVKNLLDVIPVTGRERDAARKTFTDAHPGRIRLSLGGGTVVGLHLDLALVQFVTEMGLVQFVPR